MFLNQGKFRQNGGCGYVLKPKVMRDRDEKGLLYSLCYKLCEKQVFLCHVNRFVAVSCIVGCVSKIIHDAFCGIFDIHILRWFMFIKLQIILLWCLAKFCSDGHN